VRPTGGSPPAGGPLLLPRAAGRSYFVEIMTLPSVQSRLAAAILATWLALLGVEPPALHTCPVHGAGAAHGGRPAEQPAAHAGHGGALVAADAPADHGPDGDLRHCTCLGHCCMSRPATGTTTVVLPVAAIVAIRGAMPADRQSTAVRPDFILPFATAPPS
jgi:hypothetical protein